MGERPYLVDFDPVAFSIGPVSVHWYGLAYLAAFGACWALMAHRAARPDSPLTRAQVGDFLFWAIVGVIAGGRLGYVLFYGLDRWADDWLFPLRIWDGGMSFHGGLLGVVVAMGMYARHLGCGFLRMGDFVAPVGPLGLAFGRLGNFIGGELWGRVSDVSWAMIFPEAIQAGGRTSEAFYRQYEAGALDHLARHPSQLYQAAGEGLALFAILWWFSARPRPAGAVGGLFLAGYGLFRFAAEFFREPDAHLGFLAFDWLTMGQVLSVPMFLAGIGLLAYAYRRGGR